MKQPATFIGIISSRLITFALAVAGAAALSSCTGIPSTPEEAVYKFNVLRYKEPVEISNWSVDPTQSANPEGAALNITTEMRQGDISKYLASWYDAERPSYTPAERASLIQKWHSLKDGHLIMLGRVVAGSDVIVELSVTNSQYSQELQLPLRRENGQWWLTAMDTNSEFLHWQSSTNKIVAMVDTKMLKSYLSTVNTAH